MRDDDLSTWTSIPKSFDQRTAYAMADRAKLIVAPMLPGCTSRRYDFPIWLDYSPVELCFANQGPVVPTLNLRVDKYCSSATTKLIYKLMFRDATDPAIHFFGPPMPGYARLDSGPEKMASMIRQVVSRVDFASMIAAGSIERILADEPREPVPWHNLYLALCAVYLGRDQEAQGLLRDSIRYAREDGRAPYAKVIAEAAAYLAKLQSNPDALRQELIATMESNWSHFKIVGS